MTENDAPAVAPEPMDDEDALAIDADDYERGREDDRWRAACPHYTIQSMGDRWLRCCECGAEFPDESGGQDDDYHYHR